MLFNPPWILTELETAWGLLHPELSATDVAEAILLEGGRTDQVNVDVTRLVTFVFLSA